MDQPLSHPSQAPQLRIVMLVGVVVAAQCEETPVTVSSTS